MHSDVRNPVHLQNAALALLQGVGQHNVFTKLSGAAAELKIRKTNLTLSL